MSTEVIASRQTEFAAPQEQQEENLWASIGFAWRQKWIVLLLGLVGVACGYLYFLRQVPLYESLARVLIVKPAVKMPIQGVELDSVYDSTHESLISSPLVLERAVKRLNLASMPSLAAAGSPLAAILQDIKVTGVGGQTGDVIELRYRSLSKFDAPKVLDAIVDAYQEFLGSTEKNESEVAITLIGQAKDQLDVQIKDIQRQYQQFKSEAPLLFTGESALNVHEGRLKRIEDVRSEAVLTNRKLKAEIGAITDALRQGGSREALSLLVGRLRASNEDASGRPGSLNQAGLSMEEAVFPMMLEEQMLLETYGPDHPKVMSTRKRIELTREHFLGRNAADPDKPVDFLALYLESLREQVKINDETIAEMTSLYEDERAQAKRLSEDQAKDTVLRTEIARKEQLYSAVVSSLEELSLSRAQDARGPRLEKIHPPAEGMQVEPDLQKIMLISAFLGIFAGLGLAYVVDAADRRFRSPDEIRSDFGVPVVGHIPVIPVDPKAAKAKPVLGELSPALRVYHHPRGRIAEAYRAVRTALYFSNRAGGHKVIQVTSPSPGDGKSTLSANLAVAIAQSGKKVLLIDCDLRRPRIHRLFGMDADVGMTSVLQGDVELDDAIVATSIENLYLLPCGPKPDNPSEMLTSRQFEELLDVLRERYDQVIVDTPPALVVTDPLNVSARVDGVLLVLRLTKSARQSGRRAIEALDAVGGRVVGVVVNGFGSGKGGYGGYGHGKYGYGYGYKYGYGYGYGKRGYGGNGSYGYSDGYGYGYGYGYSDDKSYYVDDDGKKVRAKKPVSVAHSDNNGKGTI